MMELIASNDEYFFKERNRTLPIHQSICSIPNYPTKLRIFLTNASRFWQVKCFFNGRTICRSLRTTSKRDAINGAKLFYEREVLKIGADLLTTTTASKQCHSVDLVATMLIAKEQARARRKDIADFTVTVVSSRLRKYIIPFFKKIPIESVNLKHINAFHQHLLSLKLSSITIVAQKCYWNHDIWK